MVPALGGGETLDVAGLAVAERTRRALTRTGFTLVPPGTASPGPVLFVASDALIEPQVLLGLAQAADADAGAMSAQDPLEAPAALLVPGREPGTEVPANAADLGALAARLHRAERLRLVPTGSALCQRVHTAADADRLTRHLVAALAQPSDGFFARYFDRRISSRLSPWLVRRGVTPNAITLFATGVGLAGAACLATQGRTLQVLGSLLFIASTILDGCDGEVARLSFTSSDFGRRLDLIGDNVVNGAVFLAIGWSAVYADSSDGMSALVSVTLTGFVLATVSGFAFSRWIERSGRGRELHNLYESLASRDFAYFVLPLALLGRLHWFVWLAAIGSYAFVALLVVLRVRLGDGPPPPPVGERQWA